MDSFDITKIEKPENRRSDSDDYFQERVMEKRSDAYWFARHGSIQKLNEYLDDEEISNYFSKSEKKYLIQSAKINFLPFALKRLEKIAKGSPGYGSGALIDKISSGDNPFYAGIQEILKFYKSNDKTTADRISAETLRLKERLLNITETAHKTSEKLKRNIDKEIEEGVE